MYGVHNIISVNAERTPHHAQESPQIYPTMVMYGDNVDGKKSSIPDTQGLISVPFFLEFSEAKTLMNVEGSFVACADFIQ